MFDCQGNDPFRLIDFFRTKAAGKSEQSSRNYMKAIACLDSFFNAYPYAADFPSTQTLGDWFAAMRAQGLSTKTAAHYLDIIAALADTTDAQTFKEFKARLKTLATLRMEESAVKRALAVLKSAAHQPGQAADIMLLAIINGETSLLKAAQTKTADVNMSNPEVADIVSRNASPRRQYLFALEQPRLTERQLAAEVDRKVRELLIMRNIPTIENADNTVRLIMAHAALRCGISGSEIIALLGEAPIGLPELALCSSADITPDQKSMLARAIATYLTSNPMRWYAMKLRPHIDFSRLIERLSAPGSPNAPELFYPYEEIARRIGKRLVYDRKPIIRDVVFFRSRLTDIAPLFSHIGDLAWCYTTSGRPGSDYAAIPAPSFHAFQEAINAFTPDYEIAPLGAYEPAPGEEVIVINGLMSTYRFDIEKILPAAGPALIQLHMIGNNGIQWRTSARPAQLHPTK